MIFNKLDVFKALRSLDTSKAMGCDGVSPVVLKHCAMAIYQPLYHLFSLSLSQFYIPLEWHTHLVKPVYKSGDSSYVRNYRPISLLCIVSKILLFMITSLSMLPRPHQSTSLGSLEVALLYNSCCSFITRSLLLSHNLKDKSL